MYRYNFLNSWFSGSISKKNRWHEMKATIVGNRLSGGKLSHKADDLQCNVSVGGHVPWLFWLPSVCNVERVRCCGKMFTCDRFSFLFLFFFLLRTMLAPWMHACDVLATLSSVGGLRDEPKKVTLLVDCVTGRAVFVR